MDGCFRLSAIFINIVCIMHQSFATTSPLGPGIAGLKYCDFTFEVSGSAVDMPSF